jgi:arylsulfatase A-like enzyme/Tfp pilus assembly protein PilF
MIRRTVLAAVIGLAAVIVTIQWVRRPAQADLRSITHQNVLLITIDTLRADALGCYGGPAATPTLDRLAAEGVRFDYAHAHAVVTLTSHASILTGRYPFQHGLRDNSGYRLPPDAATLATSLKQAGYATAAFVGAFPLHSRFGLNIGFDVYDDRFGETRAPAEFVMPERAASAVTNLARQWIAERAQAAGRAGGDRRTGEDAPWFMWVHLFDPHAPYRPPAPFDAQYAGRPYYGEVATVDAALGPLVEAVRSADRSTFVVVTGDHGEALGDHGEESHGLFAYESTLRVPLIIAEIGGVSGSQGLQGTQRTQGRSFLADVAALAFHRTGAGEVSSVSARHVDIMPTILDAVGKAVPTDLPGRSLLPSSERRAGGATRPVYFEAMSAMLNRGWAPLWGVLVAHDKFIDLPIAERYDLGSDPGEQLNLAGRSPDRDRALAAALRDYHAIVPGQRPAGDPQTIARLRALGYVSGSVPVKATYSVDDDPKRLVELDHAVHRAVEAFGQGHANEAVQIYRQVIDQRPDMAIAYRHLAFIQWQRGDATAAVETLRSALAHGVSDTRLATQLGGFLTDTGHVADAMHLLEPVASDPSADSDTLNTLGIAYARNGRRDDARRTFERVLTFNPESSVPRENLGVLALERDDLQSARKYFEDAVRVAPNSSRAHAGVGTVALRLGDHDTAFEAWTRAVELDPTNFDALYNLGVNLARDGHADRARPYLEQFLKTAPAAFFADDRREVAKLLGGSRP